MPLPRGSRAISRSRVCITTRLGLFQSVANDGIGFDTRFIIRHEIVGIVPEQTVDIRRFYETLDVERVRRLQLDGIEFVLGNDDVAILLDLVPFTRSARSMGPVSGSVGVMRTRLFVFGLII